MARAIGEELPGDTTYGFNTNISSSNNQIWAWRPPVEFPFTISDASGTDTLGQCYSSDQIIDLRAPPNRTTSIYRAWATTAKPTTSQSPWEP